MNLIDMVRTPVTATPETTVFSALCIMAEQRVGAIVITRSDRKVLGIFTERDNMMRVTLHCRDPRETRLGEVMTFPVDCVSPDTEPDEALSRMLTAGYRHLPVVDAQQCILGVLSIRQMLTVRVSEQASSLDFLQAYMSAGGPG